MQQNERGYIALFTVIIIMAVVLSTAATITFLSIGEAQSSLALYKGEDILAFVEGCTEDALWKSRADPNYNGSTFTRPEGTCVVPAIGKVGNRWTMSVNNQTSPTVQYQRTIQVVFDRLVTGIAIVSWKEI